MPESIIYRREVDIRNAVWLGNDAEFIACSAGAIAKAHLGVPEALERATLERLSVDLRTVVARSRRSG